MSGDIHGLQESLSASQLHQLLNPTQEEEDEPLRRSQDIMCLNIGGKRHWVMARNFVNFPGTRLGKLARAKGEEEVLRLCDKYWKGGCDGGRYNEYFFDVSWVGFNSILDVYRSGSLHLMSGVCALVTKNDLEYWGIDELLLEPCCALKYYPEIELCVKEVEGEEESRKKHQMRKLEEDFGQTRLGRVRKYMWNLTEYPETSKAAQVAAFVSLGVIAVSTFCFVLSTFPELQEHEEEEIIGKINSNNYNNNNNHNNNNKTTTEDASLGMIGMDFDTIRKILRIIDLVTICYFFLEYIVRFTCSPKKLKFFLKAMNFIDFLAILPYVISTLLESLQDLHILGKAGKIMRLVRVMRILRIFKLVRHFAGLQSLLYTLKQAYKELGLLIILVGVAVLTFSSLVFYAEKDSALQWTFLDSFWWGLMTLTTVGYGTQSPQSLTGKAIGGFCAIVGVFILTLPVPIVVNSFAAYYKNRLWRNEVAHKRRLRAEEQTKIVKQILTASRRPSYAGSHVSLEEDNNSGNNTCQQMMPDIYLNENFHMSPVSGRDKSRSFFARLSSPTREEKNFLRVPNADSA